MQSGNKGFALFQKRNQISIKTFEGRVVQKMLICINLRNTNTEKTS